VETLLAGGVCCKRGVLPATGALALAPTASRLLPSLAPRQVSCMAALAWLCTTCRRHGTRSHVQGWSGAVPGRGQSG
jgi:hypothetical protein